MPQSCNCSARVGMMRFSWSHPNRVFTVTGTLTAFTTSRVISSINGMFLSIPAPAPLPATFFTGQPKLMSITSGFACSTILAASTMSSTERPYICMPTGRSSSQMLSLFMVDLTDLTKASADTNSVYTMAAPKRLQSIRKPMSVTSSIGARNTGCLPNCMSPIFIYIFIYTEGYWLLIAESICYLVAVGICNGKSLYRTVGISFGVECVASTFLSFSLSQNIRLACKLIER